jgi:hypothetical protein
MNTKAPKNSFSPVRDKPPSGDRPILRDKIKALEQQIDILEKALDMKKTPMDLTMWESLGPQEARDEMACRSWWHNLSNPIDALLGLGFTMKDATNKKIQSRVLFTPGFNDILRKANRTTTENWEALVARQNKNALLAKNDGDSTRAFTMLAKIEGKMQPEPVQQVVHLHTMIGMHEQTGVKPVKTIEQKEDPLAILGHEPGEPVRISTGDKLVEKILSEREQQ